MKGKGKIRIVIADDNLILRQELKNKLTESGYLVENFKDGYELLDYLKRESADILVLDLMMPRKDGLDVFGTIKAIYPRTKIIIYTGFQRYKNSMFARAADRFLLKDDHPEKLLAVIKELTMEAKLL